MCHRRRETQFALKVIECQIHMVNEVIRGGIGCLFKVNIDAAYGCMQLRYSAAFQFEYEHQLRGQKVNVKVVEQLNRIVRSDLVFFAFFIYSAIFSSQNWQTA